MQPRNRYTSQMPQPGLDQLLIAVTANPPKRVDALASRLERETGMPVTAFAGVRDPLTGATTEYLQLHASVGDVSALAGCDAQVFPDHVGHACIYRSVNTIRADLGRRIYLADGHEIVWAVFDSGIDARHPHFARHRNLELPAPLKHLDLMASEADGPGALVDNFGHGTCLAGIIAGENENVRIAEHVLGKGNTTYVVTEVPSICGIAPRCRLLSVKVLDDNGEGQVSVTIQGLAAIQKFNEGELRVHGVNIGLGFPFDHTWYACGRSPLCIEVDRLVRSGVVVVTPAGNTGFGQHFIGSIAAQSGMQVSISDPGNAELALTVGSTHRELPAVYGVSYFSSKGPTLDGRSKPDIVAPGERIVSCSAGASAERTRSALGTGETVLYEEESGTSLAGAHVSGAAAAVLSTRRDLIGSPDLLKRVLMESAVDLGRSRFFQGSGMIDVMQALQITTATQSPALKEHFGRTTLPVQQGVLPPALRTEVVLPTAAAGPRPLLMMYSYAHKDDTFRQELDVYLTPLFRQNRIAIWQDRKILPGSEFDKDIARALEESDVILLLVSANYMASKYSWSIELKRALERHEQGTARVIPIILKPTPLWRDAPFGKLTALPKDGKAITTYENQDLAWTEVVEEIRRLITSLERR